jgi:plastocyanin
MHRRRTRLVVTAALAFAALLGSVLPAAADCEESVLSCDTDADQTEAELASVRQIATTLPLRTDNEGLSISLYRQLIPAQYLLPAEPVVGVSFTQLASPRDEAGSAATRWTQSTVALKVRSGDEEGWYPISESTDSVDVYASGRDAGLPRYLATTSLAPTAQGWKAEAVVQAQRALLLDWTAGDDVVDEATMSFSAHREPTFSVSPIFYGDERYRVKTTAKPPVPVLDAVPGAPAPLQVANATALAAPRAGAVTVSLDPNLDRLDEQSPEPLPGLAFGLGQSLADIVALEQTAPGLFWDTEALVITQTDNLDAVAEGPVPSTPPVDNYVLVGPSGVTTGYLTKVVVIRQGGGLMFRNQDEQTHDVTSEQRDPVTRLPIFNSDYTNPGETKRVNRVETLPPGQYPFLCSLHSEMKATLVVVN